MKRILNITVIFFSTLIFGQRIKEYYPVEIREIKTEFSDEFVEKYNSIESLKKCNQIWTKLSEGIIKDSDLTKEEKESLTFCDEFEGNPWSKLPSGCSWYCGGRIDTIYSSSKSTKFIHDFDYGKSWTSDIDNQISSNFIEYIFEPQSARVTSIVFVNGNVKCEKLFKEFSRAKKIKMYVNSKEFAILNFKDNKNEQVFSFKPIGIKNRKNYEEIKLLPKWSIKFEILEVYQGEKHSVSISEIYFDGALDVHEEN